MMKDQTPLDPDSNIIEISKPIKLTDEDMELVRLGQPLWWTD